MDNDKVHGEILNNTFQYPIDTDSGATGTVIEENGILYMQKCLRVELCYELCNIYGDIDDSTTILAHLTDSWSLCDNAPTFKDNPLVTDNNFNEWLLEDNRRMPYQRMLDECSDYNIFEAGKEAQEPLKPSIRPPAVED